MLVNTISTASQFVDQFKACGRGDQFSYDALSALFDYYNQFDDNIEMDVIALCCEWQEFDSLEELADAYNHQFTEEQLQDVEAHKDEIEDYFYDNTQIIVFDSYGDKYLVSEF